MITECFEQEKGVDVSFICYANSLFEHFPLMAKTPTASLGVWIKVVFILNVCIFSNSVM